MVLEDLSKLQLFKKSGFLVLFLGLFYSLFASFFSMLIFKKDLSVIVLFIITVLLTPTLAKILSRGERIERVFGIRHFFHTHKRIFSTYLYLTIGVFIGFLMIGAFISKNPDSFSNMFGYQLDFLNDRGNGEIMATADYSPSLGHFASITVNNVAVALIAFMLSLFYGAGAIFLVVLNASIFSTFLLFVINSYAGDIAAALMVIAIFMIHMIPEISGFLLAAIAGGILSKGFLREKPGTSQFKNIVKDAMLLLIIAILVIIISGFLETYVSSVIFTSIF